MSLLTLMPINCSSLSEMVIVDGHGCHTALNYGVKAKENQDKGPGGTLIFSSQVGWDATSTVHPQKISGISSTPKNIWNFSNLKKYPYSVPLTLKKALKCIEMNLKLAQFCTSPILWWPKKISTKSSYPKKYSFLWKPQKILKFKILNPKKWPEPTYVWKYQSTPPPPHPRRCTGYLNSIKTL